MAKSSAFRFALDGVRRTPSEVYIFVYGKLGPDCAKGTLSQIMLKRMNNERDDTSPQKGDDEVLQQLIEGGLRKSLGLSREHLRLGLDLAKTQMQRGRNQEAFRTYATMVLCDPSDPELQIGLANCALLVGENNLALQAASAAIILQPNDCRGFFLSGKACLALGLREESKEDLTRALELSKGTNNTTVSTGAKKYLTMIEAKS